MLNADHTDISDQMQKLKQSGIRLHGMPDRVGDAITVKEAHSERKDRLLATYTKKYLGLSAKSKAEAEVHARADVSYGEEFEALVDQLRSANQTIFKWKVECIVNDDARSLLSASKNIKDGLMG